jgi:hypothetical protein
MDTKIEQLARKVGLLQHAIAGLASSLEDPDRAWPAEELALDIHDELKAAMHGAAAGGPLIAALTIRAGRDPTTLLPPIPGLLPDITRLADVGPTSITRRGLWAWVMLDVAYAEPDGRVRSRRHIRCVWVPRPKRRGARQVRYVEWPALYVEEGEAGA